ncbi:MAG: GerW family sporulation protein [Oscillospiraceae bacterium]|jgi:sporulation protein YtfJ
MDKHPIGDVMETTMTKLKEMVDANTVVGTPINTPDGVTLIPVSRVSVGFASGGSDLPVKEKTGFGAGNGAGIKVDPIGFLVVKESNVRLISIAPPANTAVDRAIELLPELFEKVDNFLEKRKEEKE